jgi:hypothetical protein
MGPATNDPERDVHFKFSSTRSNKHDDGVSYRDFAASQEESQKNLSQGKEKWHANRRKGPKGAQEV